jgi:hypothetical protein
MEKSFFVSNKILIIIFQHLTYLTVNNIFLINKNQKQLIE